MRVEYGLLISTSLLALLASACSSSEGDEATDAGGNASLADGGASEPMGAGGSPNGSGTGGVPSPGSGGQGNTGGSLSSSGGTLSQGSGGQPGLGGQPVATSGGESGVVTDPGVGGGMTTGGSGHSGGDSNQGGAWPSAGGSGGDGSGATGGEVGPLPTTGGSNSGGAGTATGSGGRSNTGGSGSLMGSGGRRNTGGASASEVGGSTSEAGNSGAPEGGSGVGGEPSGTAAGAAGSGSDDECPCSGTIEYVLNDAESWPADVFARLSEAMEEAVWYYNCYSSLNHSLTVNYTTDGGAVPTAQANVDGWMTFGPDPAYQVLATAMHEMGHTMGVAYYPWTELTDANRHWNGAAVNDLMASLPEDEKDPGEPDFITADAMHFWPYGLNYASEYKSEWSLINHVRIVAAMNLDKQDYLSR